MSLSPTPWVQTFAYNAIGNITFKSDVGTYSYPAPGQPRPHGVTSITGGVINTTFTYDAKGNMISGNGLTVAYTSYNKTASITRGTTSIGFEHDTEHQRFSQMGPVRDHALPGGRRRVRRALRRPGRRRRAAGPTT